MEREYKEKLKELIHRLDREALEHTVLRMAEHLSEPVREALIPELSEDSGLGNPENAESIRQTYLAFVTFKRLQDP